MQISRFFADDLMLDIAMHVKCSTYVKKMVRNATDACHGSRRFWKTLVHLLSFDFTIVVSTEPVLDETSEAWRATSAWLCARRGILQLRERRELT